MTLFPLGTPHKRVAMPEEYFSLFNSLISRSSPSYPLYFTSWVYASTPVYSHTWTVISISHQVLNLKLSSTINVNYHLISCPCIQNASLFHIVMTPYQLHSHLYHISYTSCSEHLALWNQMLSDSLSYPLHLFCTGNSYPMFTAVHAYVRVRRSNGYPPLFVKLSRP